MRFRAPNINPRAGFGTGIGAGIAQAAQTFAMLPTLEAQARQEALDAQTKRDLMGTQQRLYESQIGGNLAEAALKQRQLQTIEQRPANLQLMAASRAGTSVPELNAAISERTHGAPAVGPSFLSEPIPGLGASGRTANFDDVISSLYAPAMTTPADQAINFQQLAQARGEQLDQGLQTEAADLARRGDLMGANALSAVQGGREFSPYSAVGTSGVSINKTTGAQQTADAGLRALFGDEALASIKQKNASSAASYASAAKTRKEMEQAAKSGDIVQVQQPDGTVLLVNKVTGLSRPAVGMDGKPVVKPGGGAKSLTEGQAKANLFGGRMQTSDAILTRLENDGVMRPGMIKGGAEVTGRILGLGTEGMGGTLADTLGAATNWTQSPQQQQVDQARRDFINAVLRKESGAVISPAEFANAEKQYFPQPGDSEQVIAQKRANRRIAINLMLSEVPETMRFRAEAPSGAPGVQPPATSGTSGTWGDAPAAGDGWSIQRVQ